MLRMKLATMLLIFAVTNSLGALAQTQRHALHQDVTIKWNVVKRHVGVVTSINFLGKGESTLIVTTKYGGIYSFDADGIESQPGIRLNAGLSGGLPVEWPDFYHDASDGLMGGAIDIDKNSGATFLYVYGSFGDAKKQDYRIYRFTFLSTVKLSTATLVVKNLPYSRDHSGGAMIVHDGHLYVTTSDGENAGHLKVQNLSAKEGKLLRIPLKDLRTANAALNFDSKWIYACGLRDSQGITKAKYNGKTFLIFSDHGPSGSNKQTAGKPELNHEVGITDRDELNFVPITDTNTPIRNYGWPLFAAFDRTKLVSTPPDKPCPLTHLEQPKFVWGADRIEGAGANLEKGIAPSGVAAFENSDDPHHPWNGHIFVAALEKDARQIRQMHVDKNGAIVSQSIRFSGIDPKTKEAHGDRKRAIACNSKGVCFFGTSNGDQSFRQKPDPSYCPGNKTPCTVDLIVKFHPVVNRH